MRRCLPQAFTLVLVIACFLSFVTIASADQIGVGDLSFDQISSSQNQFDITNLTGVDAFPPAFPITTLLSFSITSMIVNFSSGPALTLPGGDFTAVDAGGDLDCTAGACNLFGDSITSATLTGTLSPTTALSGLPSGDTGILAAFSTTITPDAVNCTGGTLQAGCDTAIIYATGTGTASTTPEPGAFSLVGIGVLLVGLGMKLRSASNLAKDVQPNVRRLFSIRGVSCASLVAGCIVLLQYPAQAQTLTASTNPPSGVAGFNDSYVTGSGFPAGTITGSSVVFGTSCGLPSVGTAPVIQAAVEGTLRRFEFLIPATLQKGTYFVWVRGTAGSTAFNTLNTPSCSEIMVTVTNTTIAACVPTSSLAVVAGTNVNAFVPFGAWSYGGPGIAEVPLEGSGTAATFVTPGNVNSCAANSVTGEVVCTENGTNVDLINGSTLTTITSGSNASAFFTGGSCMNCGVGINATNNTAVIAMGLVGGGPGGYAGSSSSPSGVQILNLSNNSFNTGFPLANYVSEDISIDSLRNLILSPEEGGIYDLLKIGAGNTLTEYGNNIGNNEGNLDSAAEDCTTGIALSAVEFTDTIYITDLTQATFMAGSPGTWSAPGQFINLNDGNYSAGTSGITAAPGSNHLGLVTGEYGGSSYSALQLPATSGTGTPTLADWAYVASMPTLPDGQVFEAGYDPHTVTAYTSPNNNKSYAVIADWEDGAPKYLGVVDLACVLALPRTAGTHDVIGNAASCTRYAAIP